MTFDEWWKVSGYDPYLEPFSVRRENAKAAWDHQQARIDELEQQLEGLNGAAEFCETTPAELLVLIVSMVAAVKIGEE